MKLIPDDLWPKIAQSRDGLLPTEARAELEQLIEPVKDGTALARIRKTRRVKQLLDTIDCGAEHADMLDALAQDMGFRFFLVEGDPVDVSPLKQLAADIRSVQSILRKHVPPQLLARRRHYHPEIKVYGWLLLNSFEIGDRYLSTGFPLQAFETRESGPFIEFATLILRCVGGPNIDEIIGWVIDQYRRKRKRAA